MVKNIVFDLGNVLLDFNPIIYLKTLISDKAKIQEVYAEIFTSKEWVMLDRGIITQEEAVNEICHRSIENSELIKMVMHNWYQLLTPIEDTVEVLKELKHNGYKLYFLSNFHLLAYEDVNKRYKFFEYFDGGILSYKEQLIKPDKEIYNKLIKRYKIKAEESIFIDDTIENIEGARKLSFEAILFINSKDLRKKLSEYKVL
ncbi:HAD family hydrolase [Clostridium estertheticum]|uniref:HAD family hydrolase n=1 Tax=Clostridium estertheticum TaxID=238834 RepID=UPI001C0D1B13|nr:HAD family phosphatase [Clostridium estertheticum]MBU3072814.1 HAD family phosphatase [Clostridium estertheticum]MBU3163149.1 HAD family phosphatase [Clostridium estertheticum]